MERQVYKDQKRRPDHSPVVHSALCLHGIQLMGGAPLKLLLCGFKLGINT